MKLLLIGASGVLGSRLYNDAIKEKWNVLGTYCSHEHEGLSRLDLKDKKSIENIFSFFEPEVVVLAGGITDVDLCQVKPGLAEAVNIKGTIDLIKKVKASGVKLVYVSTDYIFNGDRGPYSEEAVPSPINIYGRTKLEAEKAVQGALKDFLITRTAQLYGPDHRGMNFAVKIVRNMKKRKKVYAADDFYCTPTYVADLSGTIMELLKTDKQGIFNVAGPEFIHRYEYVIRIADIFNLDKGLIQKVKLKDLKLKAPRPKRAGLDITKIKRVLRRSFVDSQNGLNKLKKDMECL